MSNIPREQAQFRKAKTPIIAKYQDDHAQLMSAIAGRGFTRMPGYAYDAENRLELSTKMGLSELSFKILSDTIERELKQSGRDYDLSYKNALIAWEIEKQSLMSAWDAELMALKQGQAEAEGTLDLLAVEVSKRAITLMEAKTVLELEMEAYKKTLAEMEGDTAVYEVQLANAKVLTAQKKLELIPIIEEILTKEQELLVLEQSKAAEYTEYMAAENEVLLKKQTLTPFINELGTKVEELATRITTDQIPKEELIADEKVAQATAAVTKSGYHVEELSAEVQTELKRIELLGDKRTLDDTKFLYDQGILTHEEYLTWLYKNDYRANFNQIIAAERQNAASILSNKETVDATKNTMQLVSAIEKANGQIDASAREASYEVTGKNEVADAQASAKLTAGLKHLIG